MTNEPSRALARRFQETGSADDAVGAFLALAREGLRAEATLVLDEAMARGLPVDEILDSLTPGPLESIVLGALPQRGEGELWNAAWAPDERSLYVVQNAAIVRWLLGQGPRLLVDRDRIHARAQSSLGADIEASRLAVGESLVLEAAGKRLAVCVQWVPKKPTTDFTDYTDSTGYTGETCEIRPICAICGICGFRAASSSPERIQ